jgi:hypothetical protein
MRRLASLSAAVLLWLVPCAAAPAQDAPRPGDVIELFNGKDLSGWVWFTHDKNAAMEDVWSVVDGALRCKGRPVGYIRTERDYTSFILKLQIRHLKPGNGGVLIRMVGQDKVWPKSIEAQGQAGALGDIWNIDKFPMTVAEDRTRGRHTVRARRDVPEKPLGEWNDYEIIMDGGKLTLIVNGTVQNQATDCEIVAGKICLQSEGTEYEFRNIVLTVLPDQGRQ